MCTCMYEWYKKIIDTKVYVSVFLFASVSLSHNSVTISIHLMLVFSYELY